MHSIARENEFISSTRPGNAQDVAYSYVKEQIINLRYRPGQWLKAQDIARQLSISRTPVREALGRLDQEGLVRRDSGWGYVVRALTQKEIADLFKIRETVEMLAALECMASMDRGTADELARTLHEATAHLKAGDERRCRESNRRFQLQMAFATKNSLLQQLLLTVNDRIWWAGSLLYEAYPQRVADSLRENKKILVAMRSKRADRVRRAVIAHLRGSRKSFAGHAKLLSARLAGDGEAA